MQRPENINKYQEENTVKQQELKKIQDKNVPKVEDHFNIVYQPLEPIYRHMFKTIINP